MRRDKMAAAGPRLPRCGRAGGGREGSGAVPTGRGGGRSAPAPEGRPRGHSGGGGAPPARGACAAGGDSPMAPSADSVLNCCIYDSPRAGRGRGAVRQGVGLSSRSSPPCAAYRGVVLGMRCRRDQERELQPAADKCCTLEGGEKGYAPSGNSVIERAASSALLQTRGQVTRWLFLDILGKEMVCLKSSPRCAFC